MFAKRAFEQQKCCECTGPFADKSAPTETGFHTECELTRLYSVAARVIQPTSTQPRQIPRHFLLRQYRQDFQALQHALPGAQQVFLEVQGGGVEGAVQQQFDD
ncbi:hypothetical protein CFBP4215_03998 [Pseudomonas syringae pv. syringae]|nr:hypothetical protein CFBP4215_03998 [Pseudomonas syringae pv. syringae]